MAVFRIHRNVWREGGEYRLKHGAVERSGVSGSVLGTVAGIGCVVNVSSPSNPFDSYAGLLRLDRSAPKAAYTREGRASCG